MNITECIIYLNPQAQFVVWNNDYSRIVWNKKHTGLKPTLAQCENVAAVVDAIIADREGKPDRILAEIQTNLPTWTQVSTAVDNISNLAEAKVFIKKLSRVVYLLAKNAET